MFVNIFTGHEKYLLKRGQHGNKKIHCNVYGRQLFFGGILLNVNAGQSSTSQQQSRRQGPPPEAYTACEGKNAGDTAEFENPQGGTVTGKCEKEGDRLVLRPDRPKGNPDSRQKNN